MSQLPQCSHTRRSIKCCILMTHDAKGEKGRARSQEAEHTPEANLALLPKFARIDSTTPLDVLILLQVYRSSAQISLVLSSNRAKAKHTPEANLALLPKFVRIDSLLAKANILILGQVYHSVRQVVAHNALMNRFAQR